MVLRAENLDPLAALHDGRDHTKPSPSQMLVVGDDVARDPRFESLWTPESRERLGVRPTVRLDIPVTTKGDIAKYVDILRGLATRMEYIAYDRQESELGAYIALTHLIREARMKLDLAAGRKRKATR